MDEECAKLAEFVAFVQKQHLENYLPSTLVTIAGRHRERISWVVCMLALA